MGRSKKPAAERHDRIVSTKHTLAQLQRLRELACKAGLGVSSYAALVLRAHLRDPDAIDLYSESSIDPVQFRAELQAARDRRVEEISPDSMVGDPRVPIALGEIQLLEEIIAGLDRAFRRGKAS